MGKGLRLQHSQQACSLLIYWTGCFSCTWSTRHLSLSFITLVLKEQFTLDRLQCRQMDIKKETEEHSGGQEEADTGG